MDSPAEKDIINKQWGIQILVVIRELHHKFLWKFRISKSNNEHDTWSTLHHTTIFPWEESTKTKYHLIRLKRSYDQVSARLGLLLTRVSARPSTANPKHPEGARARCWKLKQTTTHERQKTETQTWSDLNNYMRPALIKTNHMTVW